MTSFERSELNDKTRAANERVDRRLQREISTLQSQGALFSKEFDREKETVRQELSSVRRLASHALNSPTRTPLLASRALRRESSPSYKIRAQMDNGAVDKCQDNVKIATKCLDVPDAASDPRRRSLPSNDKLHLPPINSGSSSLAGSRRGSHNDYLSANGSRRASEGNFDSLLSTGCTPFLTPSASISSLVSSLSNSTSRLSLSEESGEIFDRVRTFLEKLDEEKIHLEREKTFEDFDFPDVEADKTTKQENSVEL